MAQKQLNAGDSGKTGEELTARSMERGSFMKRYFASAAALLICFGMASCGRRAEDISKKERSSSAADTSSQAAETTSAEDENIFRQSADAPAGSLIYRIIGTETVGDTYKLDLILNDDYTYIYPLETDKEQGDVFYKFSSHYYLKTDASEGKLGDYEFIDINTNESLGALTADEIVERFDPTVQYEVIDWSYEDEAQLSEFEEGKLYKAESKEEMPTFINDTGDDCIVYIMDDTDYFESAYPFPVKEIDGLDREYPYIFSTSEHFYVRVEKLTADMFDPDDPEMPAIFVNGLETGEFADVPITDIMVNAGETDVNIEIALSEGSPIEMTVGAGEIYAVDWMKIDHIEIK